VFWLLLTSSTRHVRIAELAATKASINEKATRGSAPGEDAEPIQRLERPKGEAGDGKNGFNLQNAMGLEDDDEKYQAIIVSVYLPPLIFSPEVLTDVGYHPSEAFTTMSSAPMSTLPWIFAIKTQPSWQPCISWCVIKKHD
jgi:hypothetical protein